MLDDLRTAIHKWKRNREQIILIMDCNEDVRSRNFQQFLKDVGMHEIIQQRHGSEAPATYIDGSTPIDGIFAHLPSILSAVAIHVTV